MKLHFNYRTAQPADWPAIIELANYACKEPTENQETWENIFHTSTQFICESNTTIIASACLTHTSIPIIKLLFVHPDYLRKGIASGLINKIMESLKQQGNTKVLAYDCTGNTFPLLKKMGFVHNPETAQRYGENYLIYQPENILIA